MPEAKIGVFDSGVGGLSVALAIRKNLPDHEVLYRDDAEHVPYGTRNIEEIYSFTRPILETMIKEDCRVIVIACNTVTTNLIERLRSNITVPLVGMEPALKPAAKNTETGVIAVCATPRTLASKRYLWLKEEYAKHIMVLEPDCSDWSHMIESSRLDHQKITGIVEEACQKDADQIVLGCTHFHWIEELIKDTARGRAGVIQPESAVIEQLKKVLARLP